MHAYSANDAFSNDTKVDNLVTLIVTSRLKITSLDFVAAGGLMFHKHIFSYF